MCKNDTQEMESGELTLQSVTQEIEDAIRAVM